MNSLRRIALVALAAGSLVALGGAAHGARAADAPATGHVYVNDNTAPDNTVAGFDRHADGTLSPIPGSPFKVGGSGAGAVTGSQGAIQISSDGRYLLAVDAGSNQISGAAIDADGSLRPVGAPTSSGGKAPVSIAVHGRFVYVANTGAGGANYSGFTLSADGLLTPIAGATYALPDNSQPGDVLFSPDGAHLAGIRVGPDAGPSYIDSFVVNADGTLKMAPDSPFASKNIGPFGSEFRPTNSNQLFVSNAHDGAGKASVAVFNDGADGTLKAIDGSPFADNQTAACWLEISSDGNYLYTVNTAVPSISRYFIQPDGSLVLLGGTPFETGGATLRPFDLRLDPSNRYLYVVDAGVGKISAFVATGGGSLTELPSSPIDLPKGATPFGIVVN